MATLGPINISIKQYLFCLLLVLLSTAAWSQETFLDRFNSESYTNNDGSQNFNGPWIEADDNDPEEGRIYIDNDRLYFQNLDNANIERGLDLSGAISATLSLDYVRVNGDEKIDIEIWDGSKFNRIGELNGSGTFNYTFDPDYLIASSRIRFISGSGGWNDSEEMYLDNVLVTADYNANIKIDQHIVEEDVGTITFTATYTGSGFTLPFTVDYRTLNGSATDIQDYTSASGTLFFNGISGQSQTFTVAVTDDIFYELEEEFFVEMISVSNPSINIDDLGKGTILDNEEILGNSPLVLEEQFDGYVDYVTTGGTLRTQDNNTDACAITTSSSNTLSAPVPAGATIERAVLYWTNSARIMDPQVTFEENVIDATTVYTTSIAGMDFFNHSADVTDLVNNIPNISTNVFDFSGLTIDNSGSYCSFEATLGGWALMIFYNAPGLPAATINLYQGFDGNRYSNSSFTLTGFYAIGSAGAKTTILSWEGDESINNSESLTFTTPLTGTNNLGGDGSNNPPGTVNPFNSTHFDNTILPVLNNVNSHGVDLDTYDVSSFILPGETQATTSVGTGQDFVALNSVVLKVPSNLITGTVFEDVNYGGGAGREQSESGGLPIPNARVELYDSSGTLFAWENTDATGSYDFAGMANGDYTIRVVNNTVRSGRPGGAGCGNCLPVQTFKSDYQGSVRIANRDQVGGNDPTATDPNKNTLVGAQSTGEISIFNEGAVGIDFGFNFNTIVNTKEDGQGSLKQFIINSLELGEAGLDVEANSIFDPAPGKDISIFMIPTTIDPLGRPADPNFTAGYHDIFIPDGDQLPKLDMANTVIDGRTQTAYSGNTNAGVIGNGGLEVGTEGAVLPNYDRPEIQLRGDRKEVLRVKASGIEINNLAILAADKSAIDVQEGEVTITSNLIGVDAMGSPGNLEYGVVLNKGELTMENNYLAAATTAGVHIDGGISSYLVGNEFTGNGLEDGCGDNILISDGQDVTVTRNLIDSAGGTGIEGDKWVGDLIVSENTIRNNGFFPDDCKGGVYHDSGIRLLHQDAIILHNRIHENYGEGIVIPDKKAESILISRNSIFANGVRAPSLGIDLDRSEDNGDGVTINDNGDVDDGPNGRLNYPIFESAFTVNNELVIQGWARPGAVIEIFIADISLGSATLGDNQWLFSKDYGEGQRYVATVQEGQPGDLDNTTSPYSDVDGNSDTTNRFLFKIPVSSGAKAGYYLTGTATIGNTTSEFSPVVLLRPGTMITNRRITYRVNN